MSSAPTPASGSPLIAGLASALTRWASLLESVERRIPATPAPRRQWAAAEATALRWWVGLLVEPSARAVVLDQPELPARWGFSCTLPGLLPLDHPQRTGGNPTPDTPNRAFRGVQWAAARLRQLPVPSWAGPAWPQQIQATTQALTSSLRAAEGSGTLAGFISLPLEEPTADPHTWTWIRIDWLDLGVLAELEEAARALAPRPPSLFPVSTEPPVREVISALAGVHPAYAPRGGRIADKPTPLPQSGPVRFVLTWKNAQNRPTRMEVGVHLLGKGSGKRKPGLMTLLGREHGATTVRDLSALFLLHWASRRHSEETFWWWPDEHLRLCGLRPTKDNRRRLRQAIHKLAAIQLKADFGKGATRTAPLVILASQAERAWELRIHPALTAGAVPLADGTGGGWFWPYPAKALRSSSRHDRTLLLASLATPQWRMEAAKDRSALPTARLPLSTLPHRLGLRPRTAKRTADARTISALRTTLQHAQEAGLIGAWSVQAGNGDPVGNLDALMGTLHVHPTALAQAVLRGTTPIERPAWVPATGAQLRKWIAAQGWTQEKAAAVLGVGERTIQRASTKSSHPLPVQLRRALVAYLWPEEGP